MSMENGSSKYFVWKKLFQSRVKSFERKVIRKIGVCSQRCSSQTPHSLPIRTSYGTSFASSKSDLTVKSHSAFCSYSMAEVECSFALKHSHILCLTRWGRDKMDAILQMTFSTAFLWMKMFEFRLQFHWNLYQRVQLIILQLGSDKGLAPSRRQAIIWTKDG